jgi:hypothetical protein
VALAETAKLAVEIGLTDKLSPGIRKMEGRIGGLGKTARRAGKAIGVGLAAGLAAGGAIVAANVRSGIGSLVELESAVTSVDGAIAQLGLTGQITGAQVATWANEIEGDTQAAFDDKAIAAATANLIRYGKVTPKALRQAMEVMTDLAAKTGSVEGASTLLGRAMADPTKAAGKLARMGIILTKVEQDQIKALDKAGKKTEAQALLLDILARTTEGAAAAMKGPMADAQATLADVTEDAQRALAKGFLPVLMRVQKGLSKALADPRTLAAIESFGQGLAGAFDEVVKFAEKIDWGKIGAGLKVAAEWGGKFIGAISKMPPEVLGAIIALGGLNKFSGGAVSGIVSELGKGVPGAAGGVAGTGVSIGTAATGVGALAAGAVILQGIKEASYSLAGTIAGGDKAAEEKLQGVLDIGRASVGPLEMLRRLPEDIGRLAGFITGEGQQTVDAVDALKSDTRSEGAAQRRALQGIMSKQGEAVIAFRAAERSFANQRPPTVNVSTGFTVKVNVTANSVTRSVAISNRYGTNRSSRLSSGKGV